MRKTQLILIVDDERFNLNVLSDLLRPLYTLSLAKNGAQALERAGTHHPDLIILDTGLPDMDGFELIRQFKAMDKTKDIPVLFIVPGGQTEEEEKGLELGASDFITKPFHPLLIKSRVRSHLRIVRQRKLLESIALLDGLTEIPNRRKFDERFPREWKRSSRAREPLSLALLDVDFLKRYNEVNGHTRGDEALREVAGILSQSLKRPADFAARMENGKFVMLLPDTPATGAMEFCEHIRAAIAELGLEHPGSHVADRLTASIGGSTHVPDASVDPHFLMELAENMLREAKRNGRNAVRWHQAIEV